MRVIKITILIIIVFLFISSSLGYCTSNTYFYSYYHEKSNNIESTILVTGFGPFDNYDVNPSQLIAEELNEKSINEAELVGIVLPVDFKESVNVTINAIEDYNPILVILVGLSPKARLIELEKIGVNLKIMPLGEPEWFFPKKIDPDGPLFRFSAINTRKLVLDLRESNIPAQQSFFAGTYICNTVLYETLGYIEYHNLSIIAGFIHVPPLTSQDPNGMELNMMINAIELSINSILNGY
jgi:pyroglutamyl-peptidase